MTDLSIRGSKGDSKQHTPVESPDSLINISYANILDGISEGPIVGLVNGAQSIYLDKTPLANGDGSLNFTGVTWEQRTGEHDQDHISGFPAVESQSSVGVELKASQPWVQAFSNLELSAVRVQLSAGALVVTEKDGDRVGYRVAYEIDLSTDDSDYKVVHSGAFDGKTTTGYQRSIRIDLPKASRGWRLRVRRTTPDSTTSNTQATTSVGTYTEIIDAKLQYPYTALCGLKIDASQFSSIPERAYHIRGRIIQVPSNYTPATRAYAGTWDGTFKLAWTDCPAWIWRDIVLNDRYGLGRFIDSSQLDKWALYQIARYCDEMVSDGKGGREPRFTCNVYLQSRADALTVLQDLASVFRGMSYYASSQVACAADMPGDPVYTYTNANVIDGKFSRAGSSGSTRFSVAKVAWSDRENFGNQRVEYVQDQKSLARYGVRETDITAFGCVSQGQAQRAGQYILLTNRLETGTITFSVGLDGTICRPGDVIRVADQHYAGAPLAGRIKAATASTVTLDDDVKVAAGDTLVVILPKGVAETRVVRSVAGRVVTVTQAFSAVPVKESVYTIETSTLVAETYRVLTVNENFGDDKLQYDVVAIARNNSKFAAIDDGAQIIIPPTSVLPAAVQAPPTNVKLSTFDTLNQGINIATMRITWDAPRGAQSYRVWWKRNSGDWVYAGVTYTAAIEVRGIYSGTYTARVSAEGVAGNSSVWALSEPTALFGKRGEPPALASLKAESLLFGIGLTWAFPPGAEDTQRTELWYSAGTDLAKATKLADLAYPQNKHTLQGLRAGQRFFFWARLVDKSGNVGPWFPAGTELVSGTSSSDASQILDQIAGEILESHLGKELVSEIEKISGSIPGSVNDRLGTAKTELAKQIGDVNNTLSGVKTTLEGQVSTLSKNMADAKSELQQQITAVSTLAGSLPYRKDKAYSTNQSALGSDGKLYQALKAVPLNTPPPNTTYWTDVGQAVVTAAGTAASVTKLQTDVTTLGDKVTATSGKVDGFQASLNTTNDNVAKKADASAVNSLKLTVEQQGRDLTSQGTTLNGMQTAIDGKASSQALTQLASRVKLTEDKNGEQDNTLRSQSESLTSLKDTVAKKAEVSTVTQLANDVKAQGDSLSAQGSSLTKIEASLPGLAGENLLYNPSFERKAPGDTGLADGWLQTGAGGTTRTPSLVPSQLAPAEFAQRLDASGLGVGVWIRLQSTDEKRASVSAGQTLTFSAYMRGTAGLLIRAEIYFRKSDGSAASGGGFIGAYSTATSSYQRVEVTAIAPDNAASCYVYPVAFGTDSISVGFFEVDRVQLEQSSRATGWRDSGQVNAADALANASATTLLAGRVTKNEEGIKSTSELATRLSNSLVTTNSNVDKAQGAAQAANDLAGGKGKVIVQNAAPAAPDRLPQNLWIDTTNNANTPKRWTGTTWQAVTDKVASEAAAAAESALRQVASKADSSALQTLGSTVSQQGQQITADGQAITRIDASLNQVKGDTASNASATSALTGRVGATESGLTSVSGQLTEVSNSIGSVGGENLLYNPSFERRTQGNATIADGWVQTGAGGTTRTPSLVASQLSPTELAQRLDVTGLGRNVWVRLQPVDGKKVSVSAGQTLTFSAYMRGTAGLLIRAEIYFRKSDGSAASGGGFIGAYSTATSSFQRVEVTAIAPDDAASCYVYPVAVGTDSISVGFFEVDRAQLEQSSRATGWRDNGQVIAGDQSATSTAVDKLVSTVDQQGRDLTSYSSRTTTLENNLTITDGNVGKAQKAAQDAYGLADGKGKVLVQSTAPGAADRLVQNLWIDTTGGANTPKRWTGTAWQTVTDKVATDAAAAAQNALGQVATKADASAVTDLTSRVKKTEDGVSTQASQLTQLKASIGSAQPFVSGYSWDMTGSNRGWVASTSGATMAPGPAFSTVSGYTAIQTANSFGLLSGTLNPYLRIRLRRRNTNRATASMYWVNEDGGFAEARRLNWTIDITTTDWQDIELDLSGHAGWNGKTKISAIRLDMMSGNETSPQIDIAYIAVGRRSAAASAMAVSDLEVALSKQGEKITGEVGRLDQLYLDVDGVRGDIKEEARLRIEDGKALAQQTARVQTNLNGTNAAVERTSKALTYLNGVASASEVIRVQITANGIRHVGGFGIGIENTGSAVQSTFAVLADRFAILSPAGDSVSPPFATQGNQTFISDAYIREASITNAKIADAAITTAKIGDLQVNTLKIGNEAVTIPRYAGYAPRYDCNGQWQTTLVIDLFMPQAGMVLISYSANRVSNGAQTYEYNIALDGNVLAGAAAIGTESSITTGGGRYVGPGQHTVAFNIRGAPGVSLFYQNLTVQGIMR
ncbi:phage tail protein [Pseudomonas alabamensis]|uniref:phage tail protein n=1 Tax=Pseudomonas alabamensis TaxID=3064349 RepID=UPI003F64A97D